MFNEVEATCDRVAIIKDGKIVSEFDTSQITHNENKSFEVVLKNIDDFQKLLKNLPKLHKNTINIKKISVKSYDEDKKSIIIAVNDKDINSLVAMLSEFKVETFTQVKFTLEDYFMQFYREDKKFRLEV